MTFRREQVLERLAALEYQAGRPSRYIIAFSGGLDSSVLAHALAGADRPVVAVHIDHGLQEQSEEWSRHCESFAEALGIGFRCRAGLPRAMIRAVKQATAGGEPSS